MPVVVSRNNTRGNPRNCNPYSSINLVSVAEAVPKLGTKNDKPKSKGGKQVRSPLSSHTGGQPNHKGVQNGAIPKKGDRYEHNAEAMDGRNRRRRPRGTNGMGPPGKGDTSGQGEAGEGDAGEGGTGQGDENEGDAGEGNAGEGDAGEGYEDEVDAGEGNEDEGDAGEGNEDEGDAVEGDADDQDDENVVTIGNGILGGKSKSRYWYVRSTLTKKDFTRGDIWQIPYHMPNLNQKFKTDADAATDRSIMMTSYVGPVYSKWRLSVVLWKFQEKMIVAPLFTFDGAGIFKKTLDQRKELMEIINHYEKKQSRGRGSNSTLIATMLKGFPALSKNSCVRLTAAFSVDYKTNMQKAGDLSESSKAQLLNTMDGLVKKSMAEAP